MQPATPRRGAYLFPARDCIKFCPVFNFVSEEEREGKGRREREKKKKHGLADARHTLVAAGSQKHFIYVLDGSGCSVLLGTGSLLWSLAPPCIPPVPPDVNSPRLHRSPGASCMYVQDAHVCECVCLWESACTTPPALVYTLGSAAANANYRFRVAAGGFYQYFIRLTFFFFTSPKQISGDFFFLS